MRNTAWALFSVENNYDQPDHNLECIWFEKPSAAEIQSIMGITDHTVADRVFRGSVVRAGSADYRLRRISGGKKL